MKEEFLDYDSLLQEIGGPFEDRPPEREGCIPPWRFRPGAVWSSEDLGHLGNCELCASYCAAVWENECPGHGILEDYVAMGRECPLTRPLRIHLEEFGCRDCEIAVKLFEAGDIFLQIGNAVARLCGLPKLEYAEAATVEVVAFPSTSLPVPGEFDLEVFIETGGGTLHIRGFAASAAADCKDLAVDLWTAKKCHKYRIPFVKGPKGWLAESREPLPATLMIDRKSRGVAIAWVDNPRISG